MIMAERKLATNILTPEEVQLFEENFDKLQKEYKSKGSLSLDSLIPILGRPPIIPQSPDMDAMLEAWNDKAEYGRKFQKIEELLKLS